MFHDIPELDKSPDGTVTWRGRAIEHYTFTDPAAERRAAQELAQRCRHVEALGLQPSQHNTVWAWSWFEDLQPGESLTTFLDAAAEFFEREDALVVRLRRGELPPLRLTSHGTTPVDLAEVPGELEYHRLRALGYRIADAGQGANLGSCFATLAGIRTLLQRHGCGDAPSLPAARAA